jgi:sugar lactone lactonase YvrE
LYISCLAAFVACSSRGTSPSETHADGGINGDGGSNQQGDNSPQLPRSPNLVWNENQKPGDGNWQADFSAGDPSFGLYVRPQSLFAGDTLDVRISASAQTSATWQIYRLGHYGGSGGRKLAEGTTTIAPQPDPTLDPSTGLVECKWARTLATPIAADWPSGVYVMRVELPDGTARFAPFIVRDRRGVDVLVILPTNTDQAYNSFGGESLYLDTRYNLTSGHGYVVSFDRPSDPGQAGSIFLYSAMPTVEYLEANGYDVAYASDLDVHVDSSLLPRARLVLVLAHDEYWSRQMRDHYEAARAAGVSLAFLGANIGFWQVRFEAAGDGLADRRMVGYKEAASLDPRAGTPDVTAAFRSTAIDRPENGLLGVMSGDWHFVDFPWRVSNSAHWLYNGLGVQDGDRIPGLVGLESDFTQMNGATPPGLVVVGASPTVSGDYESTNDAAQATVYEPTPTSFVFASASIRFAATMSGPRAQLKAQRMLRNLIAHAGGTPVAPENTLGAADGWLAADLSQAPASLPVIAGKSGDCRAVDGAGTAARFAAPTGLTLLGDGTLVVADATAHKLRRVAASADHTVATLSGSGASGDSDGAAGSADFHAPWALATAPDGSVWVADRIAGSVRRVAGDGSVTTVLTRPAVTSPGGLAVAADGTAYVFDAQVGGLTIVHPDGSSERPALDAGPFLTGALADGSDVWFADSGRCELVRRAADGTLTPLAGQPGFADGPVAEAGFCPLGPIVRRDGALLVGDGGNDTVRIIDPIAGTVRSLAAPGAALVHPLGVAVDATRRIVYVADTGNCVIRAASY